MLDRGGDRCRGADVRLRRRHRVHGPHAEGQPAREGQRGQGRRPPVGKITSSSCPTTTRPTSRSRSTTSSAAAPGHHRDRPRQLAALGGQPLHRAFAWPEQRAGDSRRAAPSTPTTRRTRSTSTSCSTRSTRRRARAFSRPSRALRAGTRARATNLASFKYLGPSLRSLSELLGEIAAIRRCSRAWSSTARRPPAPSPPGATTSRSAGHERQRFAQAIAAENSRSTRRWPPSRRAQEGSARFKNLRPALVPLNQLTDVSRTTPRRCRHS